ncbi:MAG: S8 family serine peptidase [Planctomycetes bacterium]|nr:S8 family serine peptidase [Planctomycetota bacterium]
MRWSAWRYAIAAALAVLLAVAFWAGPPARPEAPATEPVVAGEPPAAEPAPPVHPLDAYPRWGGAWNSADVGGDGFFDPVRAQRFAEDAGTDNRFVIQLQSRALLPDPKAPLEEIVPPEGEHLVYLQFEKNPTPEQKEQLQAAGVELFRYVTGSAWPARGTRAAFEKAKALGFVRALASSDARDKLHFSVFADARPEHAQAAEGQVRYRLLTYPGTALEDLQAAAQASGGQVRPWRTSVLGPLFEVIGPPESALAMAQLPQAKFVLYAEPPVGKRDATTDENTNVTDVRDGLGLTGAGIEVMVREVYKVGTEISGFLEYHLDIEPNFFDNEPLSDAPVDDSPFVPPPYQHSTQVAGQIGGQGIEIPGAKGVAPGVMMFGYDISPQNTDAFSTADILDADSSAIRISNHSYGPTGEGDGSYDPISADWDQALRDGAEGEGLVAMFASAEVLPVRFKQIDYFSGMKNGICVSASNDTAHCGDDDPLAAVASGIATFVDFGPMLDSRIKPDCVAPGTSVTLLYRVEDFTTSNGTSFAAPAVTGMQALLFEHFLNESPGLEPSAALAKALILNSCTDIGRTGPDARYGYGITNIEKAVHVVSQHFNTPLDPLIFEGRVGTGEEDEFIVSVPTTEPLRVMLVWMDPAGEPMAAKAITNDLDLEVVTPASVTVFPFSLNANASGFGSSPTGEQSDPLATATAANRQDNVEQVVINNPASGSYTIRVRGFNVPVGDAPDDDQAYAVVVCKGEAIAATLVTAPDTPGKTVNGITYLPVVGGHVDFTVNIVGGTPPFIIDWDFDGDGTPDDTSTDVMTQSFTHPIGFDYPGGADTFVAEVTITDNSAPTQFSTQAMRTVIVLDPPEVTIAAAPLTGEVPLNVFFSAIDVTGIVETYFWDFGDSTVSLESDLNTTHLYETLGMYTVELTVTDIVGQTGTASPVDITVEKRIRDAFVQKFSGSVNYIRRTGSFTFTLVSDDLALSRQEYRNAVKAVPPKFEGKSFDLYYFSDKTEVDPEDKLGEKFETFIINKVGQRVVPNDRNKQFKIQYARKGWIVVKWGVPEDMFAPDGSSAVEVFETIGMDGFTESSDPDDPLTDFPFEVAIDTDDATYRATFNLIFKNIRGITGRATHRKP